MSWIRAMPHASASASALARVRECTATTSTPGTSSMSGTTEAAMPAAPMTPKRMGRASSPSGVRAEAGDIVVDMDRA